MLKRGRIPVVALGFIGVLALLCLALVFSGESQKDRDRRIAYTAGQIAKGNYFAWGQMFIWCERLTTQEKIMLKEACLEYSRSNQFLCVTAPPWPPVEPSRPSSATLAWVRSVVGLDTDYLRFTAVELLTRKEFPVSAFEPMFGSPKPKSWNSPGHGTLALRSSADPGQ
jgi:hypothetical protein